jgi:hypothetical protein
MKAIYKYSVLTIALAGLWLADFAPDAPFVPVFPGPAEAVIGRPLTPVSGAGVARRTTRRAVYATSASASAAQQQQAAQPQQAAPAPAALPPGTVVSALPAGCVSATVDGVSMFNCSGVYYEPKFQSNNLVYVVK